MTAPSATSRRRWRRFRYPDSLYRFAALLLFLVLVFYALDYLNVHLERLADVGGRVAVFLAERYYPPDLAYVTDADYLAYVGETMQMALLATVFGLALAVPLAWFAAFNVSPSRRFFYPLGRFSITGARAIHETIWAILFVNLLGFGPFAGVLALTMFSIGFAGKLMAEEVEGIDRGQMDAIRATGAGPVQVLIYGVIPQVKVAWTGIAIYTWDVAFRAATIVGFFGAGGMGWYLRRTIEGLETERTAAIILTILALVMASEALSAWARARVMNR